MESHGIARSRRTRSEEQRKQDLEKIERYRELEAQVRTLAARNDLSDLFPLTTRLLRLNPEHYTAWNARRRSLISGSLSKPPSGSSGSTAWPTSSRNGTTSTWSADCSAPPSNAIPPDPVCPTAGKNGILRDFEILQEELHFTLPLLMEHPKCYWLWNHRTWALEESVRRAGPRARPAWEAELHLTDKMLARDKRNFHAWGYRRAVVARLQGPDLGGTSLAEAELEHTTQMIRRDLSNFSAWHSRSRLIAVVLDERGADDEARRDFLDSELALMRDALNVGPEDQSLWYYHQFLMRNLAEPDRSFTPALGQEERARYVQGEIDAIKDLLEDYDDVKSIYEALIEYTLVLCRLRGQQPEVEKADLATWLAKLRELDPMRKGRWDDMERSWGEQRRAQK